MRRWSSLLLLSGLLGGAEGWVSGAYAGYFDFIVVGSGPGGATVAKYLTDSGRYKVLLLEAGDDLDKTDPYIRDGEYAPRLEGRDFISKYYYTVTTQNNPISNGDDAYIAGRLFGGSSSVNGMQWVRPTSYTTSTSYLKRLESAAKGISANDSDWNVATLQATLKELETFTPGTSQPLTPVHGTSGPVAVRMSPADPNASTYANKFVKAVKDSRLAWPDVSTPDIIDYNDPTTPTGQFTQWQLSMTNSGKRSSSSSSMLNDNVRKRPNLLIKARATVTYINFDAMKRANAVEFVQDGQCYRALVKNTVILAAGIRTSLILENSGIGSETGIQDFVRAAGRKVIAHLPGVGENLGNEGYYPITFTKATNESTPTTSMFDYDIYAGGAFLPYPSDGIEELEANNATQCRPSSRRLMERTDRVLHGEVDDGDDDVLCRVARRRRLLGLPEHGGDADEEGVVHRRLHTSKDVNVRFSQLIGTETESTFTLLGVFLGMGFKGYAHIQSADPLSLPTANPRIFTGSHDAYYTCGFIQYQLLPIVKKMLEQTPGMTLMKPTLKDLGDEELGRSCRDTLTWAYEAYKHTHHWFGTTKMATRASGGVVDNAGKVYGVTGLRVADNSLLPNKPDGNTQTYAYLVGATIAKKILAGK